MVPRCYGGSTSSRKSYRRIAKFVIARCGVGVDRIDLKAAAERGIVVTNTPFANAVSVAELTIGFILMLARSLYTLIYRNAGRSVAPRCRALA